jgi:membrane dipeptidase
MSVKDSRFLAESFAWDNHSCMPLRPDDDGFLPQLERARAAGFSAVTLNVGFGDQPPEPHIKVLASFRHWLKQYPDRYQLVSTVADLDAAHAAGKLGVLFDIEGARGVGDQLSLVELYYDLGVRWLLIAYNRANLAGSGCFDETDEGLTAFGRKLVREMNRVGMTVCCTHTGARTARDVLEISEQPVIFSHSNCAALRPHTRNISDEMIRACAAQGGVIGINGIGDFLAEPGADLVEAIVRHIDHVAQLVGPAHVGLSLDYVYDQEELATYLRSMPHIFPAGQFSIPLPMAGPEALPAIVEKLFARGYTADDVRQVVGGSWRRIAETNWRR